MKQVYTYNHLVRSYNRTKHKLQKLFADGKNIRKQDILKRRLHKLFNKLSILQYLVKKATVVGMLSAGIFLFHPGSAKAQITFAQHPAPVRAFLDFFPYGGDGSPALADLDGDGKIDILSGAHNGKFYYLHNTGSVVSPEFETMLTNPFALTDIGSRSTPAFADLDNDGDLDMLSGETSGNFYYFVNTGTSTSPVFAAPLINPYSLVGGGSISKPEFADLDNDGDMDLLAGTASGSFVYFKNIGTTLSPLFDVPVTNPFLLSDIGTDSKPAFADLDNDGDFDMMALGGDLMYHYFENTGTASAPTFAAAIEMPFNLDKNGFGAFADLDADGDMDMISAGAEDDFMYFPNSGSASLPDFTSEGFNVFEFFPKNCAAADMDADGDIDFVEGTGDGIFNYYENTGTPENPFFAASYDEPDAFSGLYVDFVFGESSPALADLDADGDFDLLSGDVYGDFYYFQNVGTATAPVFTPSSGTKNPFSLTGTLEYSTPVFSDLDNDGDLDLLSGNAAGSFDYYQNTGTPEAPHFATVLHHPFSLPNLSYYSVAAFADLDADGDQDILATGGDDDGDFKYLKNTGTATAPHFAAPAINPFSLSSVHDPQPTVTFADFDNDGDMDLLTSGGVSGFIYIENITCVTAFYYADTDGDGYGNASSSVSSCTPVTGYVVNNTDCNDADASVHPAAAELCNAIDDDCDGSTDEGIIYTVSIEAAGATSFCPGGSVTLNATGSPGSLQWKRNGSAISGATAGSYITSTSGTYTCQVSDICGTANSSGIHVTRYKNPAAAITAGGPTTFCAGGSVTLSEVPIAGCTYQWFNGTTAISGAISTSYVAVSTGNYKCRVTKTSTGCIKSSNKIMVTVSCRETGVADEGLLVYPNPAKDKFIVVFNSANTNSEKATIKITDITGKTIDERTALLQNGKMQEEIILNGVASGLYNVLIQTTDSIVMQSVIVTK